MGTAGGEPKVLLNALKPMLGVVGDIKTPQEVLRVIGMMKDAEKLMSRCVYLNILKATCRQAKKDEVKKETLERFLKTGGWIILNKWLLEFTKSENFPVLLELIGVLKIMPITVELLKQGNTGKLLKQMTKLENNEVKKNATQLIKQWKEMIRGGSNESQDISNKRNRETDQNLGDKPPEKRSKNTAGGDKHVADSSGFMNALNAAAPASLKKKRRSSKEKTMLPLDEILSKSNNDKKPKFETDADKMDSPVTSPDMVVDSDEQGGLHFSSPAVEAANRALQENTDDTVIVDEGSLARKKNKKKRNITWATDDKLVQISYFELLPGERKGHHAENFSLARQHELMLEKQALRSRRGEDKMTEMVHWSRLIPVDNAGVPNFTPGENSREKYIQGEREKNVLAFIFLTKESLPASPSEPDFDPDEHRVVSPPRVIPHDEDGTVFPVAKSTNHPQNPSQNHTDDNVSTSPTLKTPPVSKSKDDMSPAVQNIMAHLLQNNNQPSTNNKSNGGQPNNSMSPSSVPPNVNNNPPKRNNQSTEGIPSILDNPILNPRSSRGMMGGPRFPGRGSGPPRGRGGFNPRGSGGGPPGGGTRQRWDGPMGQQDDWKYDNYDNSGYDNNNYDNNNYDNNNYDNNNYDNSGYDNSNYDNNSYDNNSYDNYNYNEGYNDNYNENFRGGPQNNRGGGNFGPGRNDGNFGNNRGGGRGFHRGGMNNRGRGGGQNNRGSIGSQGRGRGSGREKPVCTHFLSGRGCRHGDRCNFLHPRR